MDSTRTSMDAQTDPKPGDIVAGREVYLRAGDRLIYHPPSRRYPVWTTVATWKSWAMRARVDRVAP